jgi:hypothetical protein
MTRKWWSRGRRRGLWAVVGGSQTRCHGEGSRAAVVGETGVEDEPYYRRRGESARPVGAGVFKCESENNIGVNPIEFDRFQNIVSYCSYIYYHCSYC